MSIFAAVKNVLSIATSDRDTELRYLRELHEKQTGTAPRTWYRVVNPAGNLVGFCYVCACGTSYELLSVEQWMGKTNVCGCGHKFNLIESLGIPADVKVSDYPKFFARLALTPRLTQPKQAPSGMPVGDWGDSADSAGWSGTKQAARIGTDINEGLW